MSYVEKEKVRIRPLNDRTDYRLWKIRVESACKAMHLDDVLTADELPATDATDKSNLAKFAKRQCKASSLIVSALSDQALRVVRSVIGFPFRMMEKLDARYNSRTTASKISKMGLLFSMKLERTSGSLEEHVDRMADIIDQLRSMNTTVEESLAVGVLLSSIVAPELQNVTAAIRTLADDNLTWEVATERLLDEHRTLLRNDSDDENATYGTRRAYTARAVPRCEICGKRGHTTEKCWLNPRNPDNKLRLSSSVQSMMSKVGRACRRRRRSRRRQKKCFKGEKSSNERARASTARIMPEVKRGSNKLLDATIAAHMVTSTDVLEKARPCRRDIKAGTDKKYCVSAKDVRPVKWRGDKGTQRVNLSNNLVVENLSQSALSVPALVAKGIAVTFVPGKAFLFDTNDSDNLLGIAKQGTDGLFYITDDESRVARRRGGVRKNKNASARRIFLERAECSFGPSTTDCDTGSESSATMSRYSCSHEQSDNDQRGSSSEDGASLSRTSLSNLDVSYIGGKSRKDGGRSDKNLSLSYVQP